MTHYGAMGVTLKRLIEDVEQGKIGTVIVKDMSRVGRDYLQVGFYTEVLFREKGVHFIAISNGVDSEKGKVRSLRATIKYRCCYRMFPSGC